MARDHVVRARISGDGLAALAAIAADRKWSVAQVVREACAEYARKNRAPAARGNPVELVVERAEDSA